MGLFDSIKQQLLGGGGDANALVNAVVSVLGNQKSGGLTGLVEQFTGKGLGDIVNSWVSTGKNLPITPEQLKDGLGENIIGTIASQSGISTDQAVSQLSTLLPQIVDKLTPEGKVSQGDIMSKGMDLLKGLLK